MCTTGVCGCKPQFHHTMSYNTHLTFYQEVFARLDVIEQKADEILARLATLEDAQLVETP